MLCLPAPHIPLVVSFIPFLSSSPSLSSSSLSSWFPHSALLSRFVVVWRVACVVRVDVWLCGCVALWLCGCVAVCVCVVCVCAFGSVVVCGWVFRVPKRYPMTL